MKGIRSSTHCIQSHPICQRNQTDHHNDNFWGYIDHQRRIQTHRTDTGIRNDLHLYPVVGVQEKKRKENKEEIERIGLKRKESGQENTNKEEQELMEWKGKKN